MKELTVDAAIGNIPAVTEFVDAALEALDCPVKVRMQVDIAIDEILSNIAHYAYKSGTGPATVRLETESDPPAAVITFLDRGVPYDPLAKADPDVSLGAERQIGGLGVYLVKKTMDSVEYEYKDGRNILRIRKRF